MINDGQNLETRIYGENKDRNVSWDRKVTLTFTSKYVLTQQSAFFQSYFFPFCSKLGIYDFEFPILFRVNNIWF